MPIVTAAICCDSCVTGDAARLTCEEKQQNNAFL